MKWFILTTIFAAALLSGGCDPLNPYALSGPQGDEDTTSQDATGSADITTDSGVETTDTSADTTTPVDPCEACASDETCWDGNLCVENAWVTLVTEKIPGTWVEVGDLDDIETASLQKLGDSYRLGDFPGQVQGISPFAISSDGTVDFTFEHNDAHVVGKFEMVDGTFQLAYTVSAPGDDPYHTTIVRTSP